jgi:hypothetical protein
MEVGMVVDLQSVGWCRQQPLLALLATAVGTVGVGAAAAAAAAAHMVA